MDCQTGKGPLLVSGLLLPVWCVGAHTRFLMTRCTIPTFVNAFAGNLYFILYISIIFSAKLVDRIDIYYIGKLDVSHGEVI